MTHNEIAYWELQRQKAADAETRRANLAREEETYRSNVAKETETGRSNIARETETHRSNTAEEKETSRHNKATEVISGAKTASGIFGPKLGLAGLGALGGRLASKGVVATTANALLGSAKRIVPGVLIGAAIGKVAGDKIKEKQSTFKGNSKKVAKVGKKGILNQSNDKRTPDEKLEGYRGGR